MMIPNELLRVDPDEVQYSDTRAGRLWDLEVDVEQLPKSERYGALMTRIMAPAFEAKRRELEELTGGTLGDWVSCGKNGCITSVGDDRVLKVTPAKSEARFWAYAHFMQEYEPEDCLAVHTPTVHEIMQWNTLADDQSRYGLDRSYYLIVRADTAPLVEIDFDEEGRPESRWSEETLRRFPSLRRSDDDVMSPTEAAILVDRIIEQAEDARAFEVMEELMPLSDQFHELDTCVSEHELQDVHLANVRWKLGENTLAITDADKHLGMLPAAPAFLFNGKGDYWVFEMHGDEPVMLSERLPYKSAVMFARIGAQQGTYDRVVTNDPNRKDFAILRRYQGGSGEQVD